MKNSTKFGSKAPPQLKQTKAVYFLACLEITFMDNAGESGITRVNTMIKSETGNVGVKLLGRAQQAAQLQLAEKLNDPELKFLNVIFITINMLGAMTQTEFEAND